MSIKQHIQDNVTGVTARVYRVTYTVSRVIVRKEGKIVFADYMSNKSLPGFLKLVFPNRELA